MYISTCVGTLVIAYSRTVVVEADVKVPLDLAFLYVMLCYVLSESEMMRYNALDRHCRNFIRMGMFHLSCPCESNVAPRNAVRPFLTYAPDADRSGTKLFHTICMDTIEQS